MSLRIMTRLHYLIDISALLPPMEYFHSPCPSYPYNITHYSIGTHSESLFWWCLTTIKELCHVSISKAACDPDFINLFIFYWRVQQCSHISVPLSHLCNQSLLTDTLSFWLGVRQCCTHTQMERYCKHILISLPGNYQPISFTSVIESIANTPMSSFSFSESSSPQSVTTWL